MPFIAPTWYLGMLIWTGYITIPIIIAVSIAFIAHKKSGKNHEKIIIITLGVCLIAAIFAPNILWHYQYEVPSISEKTVTVSSWQPKAGIDVNENGLMVIDSADDLMMVTSTGEGFLNEENFLFFKFNTRDIYNQLKINGTYKIKYYGWREGFNSGFPNILSVEEIMDENNTQINNNFGNSLVYGF